MTVRTTGTHAALGPLTRRLRPTWAGLDRWRAVTERIPPPYLVLAALVIAQTGWLAVWFSRGWYVNDDFSFLAQAIHQPLTWKYLTANSAGHLFPGFRLLFWLVARGTHLDYAATVALRLLLQAAATILLCRLLFALTRSWRPALAITAVYAVTPVILPGTLYLSAALNLLPAQVCILIAYLGVVRHAHSGSNWAALQAGLGLVAAALFWEKTALDSAPVLALLMIGWLTSGAPRARAVAIARDWRAWLLTFGPMIGFGIYYLAGHYSGSAKGVPLHVLPKLAWQEWARALWPSIIGAPWKWFALPNEFIAIGAPSHLAVVLGQVGFGVLIVVGLRRRGWRSVLVWVPLAVALFVGMTSVAVGRYAFVAAAPTVDYHYLFDLAIPAAVCAALLFRSPLAEPALELPSPSSQPAGRAGWGHRLQIAGAVIASCALVVSSVVSSARWTRRWHESPARSYVGTLSKAAHAQTTRPAVYDTQLPAGVITPLDPDRNLSDLAAVARVPLTFEGGSPGLQLVTETGTLVPATFQTAATAVTPANPVCPTLITGVQSVTLQLAPKLAPNYYFLRLQYFQNTVGTVTVTAQASNGHGVAVTNADDVQLDQPIGQHVFKLALGAPASVTIAGTTASTHLCASLVTVGGPVSALP